MEHSDFAHSVGEYAQQKAIYPPPFLHGPDHSAPNLIDPDFEDEDQHSSYQSGSGRNSSGPDSAVFDDDPRDPTRHSSPHTSQHSDSDISSLPPSSRLPSYILPHRASSPYPPLAPRSPFRHPSSVRAIQLSTTPPNHLTRDAPSSSHALKRLPPSSSRTSTPRSTRSHPTRSLSRLLAPSPTKTRREKPLKLLHVTVLPLRTRYSEQTLQAVLPARARANWKLLREKVSPTVLERGILIAHPREEYELLEERLLESLELRVPRILRCGHFHHVEGEEEEGDGEGEGEERGYESDEDADICDDCGRRVRDDRFGTGSGAKRWEISAYASNGLMRAGAWAAAWWEMERVDVEITPWLEDSVKRELELRSAEEEEEEELHSMSPEVHAHEQPQLEQSYLDVERMREIYGEDAQAYLEKIEQQQQQQQQQHVRSAPRPRGRPDIPLWILVRNYLYLILQDRRNIAILLLSLLVAFLSLRGGPASKALGPAVSPVVDPVASIVDNITVPTMLRSSSATAVASAVPETAVAAPTALQLADGLDGMVDAVDRTVDGVVGAIGEYVHL